MDDGVKFYHQSAGKGNILLLHGGPGMPGTEIWPAFKNLADNYTVHYCSNITNGSVPNSKWGQKSFYRLSSGREKYMKWICLNNPGTCWLMMPD